MADGAHQASKLKVFISYRRDERSIADDLIAGLVGSDVEPIFDQKDIEAGEDWRARIAKLIDDSGAVVIALSPSWTKSEICIWEFEHAKQRGKRIFPVVVARLDGATVPADMSALNYIYHYYDERHQESGPHKAMRKLSEILRKDLDWLRAYARIEDRARDWEGSNRDKDILWIGTQLADARALLTRRPPEQPLPTALVQEFLTCCGEKEVTRQSTDQKVDELHAAGKGKPQSMKTYVRRVREVRMPLKLTNIGPPQQGGQHTNVNVTDVFVPQEVVLDIVPGRPPTPGENKDKTAGTDNQNEQGDAENKKEAEPAAAAGTKGVVSKQGSTRNVHEWLSTTTSSRLVLLGAPGHGKSTLASDLALRLLPSEAELDVLPDGDLPSWTTSSLQRVPFVIELGDFIKKKNSVKNEVNTFVDYLDFIGQNEYYGLEKAAIERLLKDCPTLVVLEGLDEVRDKEQQKELVKDITGFVGGHDKARVLVTCRKGEYSAETQETLIAARFEHATLQPFKDEQIDSFLSGWFKRQYPGNPAKQDEGISRVKQTLKFPTVRAVAGSPLLLTLLVILADSEATLRTRADFFKEAVRLLAQRWSQTRDDTDRELSNAFLLEKQKLQLLRMIAWRIHDAEGGRSNEIAEDDLKALVQSYLENERSLTRDKAIILADKFVNTLPRLSLLLHEKGNESYGFEHDQFLEYLIADAIRDRLYTKSAKVEPLTVEQVEQVFSEHGTERGWQERLALVCGVVEAPEAATFIRALDYDKHHLPDKDERLAMALTYLAEVDPAELVGPLADVADDLLRSGMDEIDPDDLGEVFAGRIGQALLGAAQRIRTDWPDSEWLDHEIIEKILQVTAEGSDAPIGDGLDLARYGWRLGQIHCAIVQEAGARKFVELTEHEDAPVRATAVGALFAYGEQVAAVKPVSIDVSIKLADGDEDPIVRQAGLHTFPDPEEKIPAEKREIVFDLFRRHALEDGDERPRIAAIRELANCFGKRDEVLELLKRCAEYDPEALPRLHAIDRLHIKFPDRSDREPLRDFLYKLAEKDGSSENRSLVLRTIAQRYGNDPLSIQLFERLALRDPAVDTRSVAIEQFADCSRDPVALNAWLKSQATDAQFARNRSTAMTLLARRSYDSDETVVGFLRTCATSDPDPLPRSTAVQLLERFMRRHPALYDFVKVVAEKDQDAVPRAQALAILYRRQPGEATEREDLLRLARRRAVEDKSSSIRVSALQYLSRQLLAREDHKLVTRDVDGLAPWLDPAEEIGSKMLDAVVRRLRISPAEVLERYEAINQRLGIRLGIESTETKASAKEAKAEKVVATPLADIRVSQPSPTASSTVHPIAAPGAVGDGQIRPTAVPPAILAAMTTPLPATSPPPVVAPTPAAAPIPRPPAAPVPQSAPPAQAAGVPAAQAATVAAAQAATVAAASMPADPPPAVVAPPPVAPAPAPAPAPSPPVAVPLMPAQPPSPALAAMTAAASPVVSALVPAPVSPSAPAPATSERPVWPWALLAFLISMAAAAGVVWYTGLAPGLLPWPPR